MKQHREGNWAESEDGQFCARNLDHQFLASLYKSGCEFNGLTEKQVKALNDIRAEFGEYLEKSSEPPTLTERADSILALIDALEEALAKVKNGMGKAL